MPKKHLIILLLIVIASITKQSYGQWDSTKQTKKSFENYYAPWHRTINDTAKWNVSKFGHYFSLGAGVQHDNIFGGFGILSSYSLAYKSHLLSVSYGGGGQSVRTSAGSGYGGNSLSFLVGESVRFKHFMLSLSVGIASTYIWVIEPVFQKYGFLYEKDRGITLPIEFKAFYLARNGIGIGLHITENIISPTKYSPFYFGGSLVFGKWNKRKK